METRLSFVLVLVALLVLSLGLIPTALAQDPATPGLGFFGGQTPQPPLSPGQQAQPPESASSTEQEPNDRFSQANAIAPSVTVAGAIAPKGDNDWYKVPFPSPGVLDVVIPGMPVDGVADAVVIRLFNDNADVVHDWAVPPRKGEATMPIWDIPKAGTYYFQVAENYNDAETPYSLQFRFTAVADPGENNDVFSKAIPIQPGTPIQAYIFPLGDTDWYVFDMPGRARLHVLVTDVPKEMEMAIRIYNADAGVVHDWYAAPHPGENTENTYDFKEPGRYYLQVSDSYSNARSTAPYTLSFDISPAVDPLENNDRYADALPIAAGAEVTDSIFPQNDTDWYQLTVPTPGTLQVSITDYPSELDMVARVYNADKALVCDWQGPPRAGEDTNFTCELGEAGAHYIEVADSYHNAWSLDPYHLEYGFVSKP